MIQQLFMVYVQRVKFNLNSSSIIDCFTKINKDGKLNIYNPANVLLPNRLPGFWIVHDEIESLNKQAIVDAAKFLLQDVGIEGVGGVAATAAQGVATITLCLGISNIIDDITGGGSNPPTPIDITAINI